MSADESDEPAIPPPPLTPEVRRTRDLAWYLLHLAGLSTRQIAELAPHLGGSQPQISRRIEDVRKRAAEAAGTDDPRTILAHVARNMRSLHRGR